MRACVRACVYTAQVDEVQSRIWMLLYLAPVSSFLMLDEEVVDEDVQVEAVFMDFVTPNVRHEKHPVEPRLCLHKRDSRVSVSCTYTDRKNEGDILPRRYRYTL